MEKMINDYLATRLGMEPSETRYKELLATVNYLKDNGKTNKEIFKILMNSNIDLPEDCEMSAVDKAIVRQSDLPEYLWKDSLLEKGVYYYNNRLHICSKPPTWNPKTFQEECEPFYMEMIISFTIEDLLEMYYMECRVPLGLRDKVRDTGALKHLLGKYNNLKAPGLDYVIYMIDLASKDTDTEFLANPFELENYSKQAFMELESMVEEATLNNSNKITWRNENAM